MRNILKTEKFPYLLVMLFAVLAYGLTHITDRLTSLPLIKYDINRSTEKGIYVLEYVVTNITKDKEYEELDFLIAPEEESDTISMGICRILPPIKINSTKDIFNWDKRTVSFHLEKFQPNCTFLIKIKKHHSVEPPLRITSKSTIYLSKSSYQTYVLEHEIPILIVLILCCIGLIILYLFTYRPVNP